MVRLIVWCGVALLPDQGASWYYWQLPEPTAWTRASAWVGYTAHQVVPWALIFHAQTRVRRYTTGLHRVNVVALAANGGFIALHAVQTQVFYDGTAQGVSIFSSQGIEYLLVAVLALLLWVPLRLTRALRSTKDEEVRSGRGPSTLV